MWLEGADGDWIEITAVDRSERTLQVYNFTVEGQHTYYVLAGDNSLLVHNAGNRKRSDPEQVCPIGPYAGDSIPARSKDRDFTDGERDRIDELGFAFGCHTCGSIDPGAGGRFVPDHQPISSWVPDGTPQRLYPQCRPCSSRQGGWANQLKSVMKGIYEAAIRE
jgi:hypothetical protein